MKRTWTTALATIAAMLCVCAVLFGITGLPFAGAPSGAANIAPAHTAPVSGNAANSTFDTESAGPNPVDGEAPHEAEDDASAFEPGTVLATLADGVTADDAISDLNKIADLEGISLESSVTDTVVKLSLPANVSVDEATTLIKTNDAFKSASPNHYLYTQESVSASNAATNALIQTSTDQSAQLVVGTALGDALEAQSASANDPKYLDGTQWSLENATIPGAWDKVLGSNSSNHSSVTVAVIDAGFDLNHNDLKANVVAPYDATTETSSIEPNNLNKSQYDHGTHASGIIAANTNNGQGVAGVTYNICKILPVRVEDENGKITVEYLLRALDYVRSNAAAYNIRVINMSLGSATYETVTRNTNPQLYDAIADARDDGIVTVVAACNAGTKGKTSAEDSTKIAYQPPFHAFPSDFDNVVSVINLQKDSSHTADNNVTRASTSNYNTDSRHEKNISAPGESIYGLISNQQYNYKSGTSMASPLVAGVLALVFQANPDLTCDEAIDILYSTARDLTTGDHMGIGWDEGSGYGEVDAAKAVATAMGPQSQIDIASLPITVSRARYTGEAIEPTVTISNGSTTLVEGVDYEIATAGARIDAGAYALTINGKGVYTGTATATFTIEKAPLSQANLALGTTELIYNGSIQYAKESLTAFDIGLNAGTKLINGAEGDFTAEDPGTRLGAGTVTVTATSNCKNFTGSATLNYIVSGIDINDLSITVSSARYTGEAIEPTVTTSMDEVTLVEGVDYEVKVEGDCVDAGIYPLIIEAKEGGACTGSTNKTFTIEKAPLAQANIKLGMPDLIYNGSKQYGKSSLTATDIGLNAATALKKGADGDFIVKDPGTKLGKGTVTLTATSTCKNFTGTATLDYNVSMKKAPVYALYNKKTKQWFYTASDAERTAKLKAGWVGKGKVWKTPSESTKPVWRLFNKKTGAYRYTADKSMRSKLVKAGWKNQGIAWYADDYYKTKPVYAQYKKATGTWRYAKKKSLSGFTNKGIAFYCL